jgi:hypothetical protein
MLQLFGLMVREIMGEIACCRQENLLGGQNHADLNSLDTRFIVHVEHTLLDLADEPRSERVQVNTGAFSVCF